MNRLPERILLNPHGCKPILNEVMDRIKGETRPEEKGTGAFVSAHEILGVLQEEHHEFLQEVISNHRGAAISELFDIAVVCIWGILSLRETEENTNDISTNTTT